MTRYLDLEQDEPEEYEGRHIVVDGAEYVIGPWFAEGGERIVHGLTNVRAGLTLHLLKVLKNQQEGARISRNTAASLSRLRDLGIPTVPEAMLVEGHGGVFELEEAAQEERGPVGQLVASAWEAAGQGRWEQVESLCARVLNANDHHVMAMHLMAMACEARGDLNRAIGYEDAAIAVEPNVRPFREIWMRCMARAGAVHGFLAGFAAFRDKWPVDNRQNAAAVEVHLAMGRPDRAAGLPLRDEERDLSRRIAEENENRGRALTLTAEAYQAFAAERPHQVADLLRAAYRAYPKEVDVAYNWGLELIRQDEPGEAYDVIAPLVQMITPVNRTQCIGTVAFTCALQGGDEQAAGLLALAVDGLERRGPLQWADLPMWAVWIQRDMVLADRHRASALVRDLLERLSTRAPAQLRRLAAAYETQPSEDRGGTTPA
ncbi:tetratricopeptide repeat protein [Sphaerisporangium aureirubrum]|uniref:Tetratricopeptide repeat protein n=1 Tax=Sphaerisporangium aureirubrum TaxID=1544736 RepID=A0ABW1NP54_9ACTN